MSRRNRQVLYGIALVGFMSATAIAMPLAPDTSLASDERADVMAARGGGEDCYSAGSSTLCGVAYLSFLGCIKTECDPVPEGGYDCPISHAPIWTSLTYMDSLVWPAAPGYTEDSWLEKDVVCVGLQTCTGGCITLTSEGVDYHYCEGHPDAAVNFAEYPPFDTLTDLYLSSPEECNVYE